MNFHLKHWICAIEACAHALLGYITHNDMIAQIQPQLPP